MNKHSKLILKSPSAAIQIWISSLEDEIIPYCLNSPGDKHDELHVERLPNCYFETPTNEEISRGGCTSKGHVKKR
jgi:hypothetical protein